MRKRPYVGRVPYPIIRIIRGNINMVDVVNSLRFSALLAKDEVLHYFGFPPCSETEQRDHSVRYDETKMAVYLITGIGGFIGSSLARALLGRGERVRGVDNFATGKRENLTDILGQIDFRQADILDLDAMHSACEGVDYVFHQAAIPSVPKSVLDPIGNNRANIDGTVNVLVAARDAKVKRVIYAASSSATATPHAAQEGGDDAQSHLAVRGCEVGQRVLHDFVLSLLRTGNGLLALLQYLWTTAGPDFALFRGSGEIHHHMLRGEQPTIFGDGEQSRDFTYIDNAVDANIWPAKLPQPSCGSRV